MSISSEWLHLENQIKKMLSSSQNIGQFTPEQLQNDLQQLKRCADATDLLIKKLQNFKLQLSAVSFKKKTALDEHFLKEHISPSKPRS